MSLSRSSLGRIHHVTRSIMPKLSGLNAIGVVLQLIVAWVLVPGSNLRALSIDTLISPGSSAFSIWILIDVLTVVAVVTDVWFSTNSLFHRAANPTVLRLLFAASVVLQIAWMGIAHSGATLLAAVVVTLLWLVLLPLYVFAMYESMVRPFLWQQYVCGELFLRLEFAWITVTTVLSWTGAGQSLIGGDLALESYLGLLGMLVAILLIGTVYGQDPIMGLTAVWMLGALIGKDTTNLPFDAKETSTRVQAAAILALSVLVVMLTVLPIERAVLLHSTRTRLMQYAKVDAPDTARSAYGTTTSDTHPSPSPSSSN